MATKKDCRVEAKSKSAESFDSFQDKLRRSHLAFISISCVQNIFRKHAASTSMYASRQRPCWRECCLIYPGRSLIRSITVILASILFLFFLAACSDKKISEEDQIKAVVEKAIIAAEKKELGKLVDIMAENYSDQYNKDRKQAGKMLRLYFFRNKSIHLFTNIKSIQILDGEAQQNSDQKRAVLQMYVGIAGRPIKDKSALGVRADLLLFTMDMVKGGDDWLVEKADWKRASQSDL